jgi:energy-coupling factor transporter ATP-binding protein EcfA2
LALFQQKKNARLSFTNHADKPHQRVEKSHQWGYNAGMPGSIEYLTINESNALLKAIDDTRDFAIVTLFLNAGLFLSEIIDLKVNSIDWDKHIVRVPGNRKRDITLDEQAYEAIARWSKDRADVKNNAFFITTKGKVKELSDRAVDKLIRKYADQAGLKRKVNSQILRNTFAVRLFSKQVEIDKASAILGITDPESINRYIKAAKSPVPQIPEHIDTRSKLAKTISRIFPTRPKVAKPTTAIKGPIIPSPEEVIFGRESVIEDIKSNISKNNPTLLIGPLGIGKTHILKYISHLYPEAIFIDSPVPIKLLLTQILDKLNPDWKKQVKARASLQEITSLLISNIASKAKTRPLIIDNLERIRASDADILIRLLDNFTIITAVEDTADRLKQLWFKFKQIKLNNLNHEASQKLIKYLTQNLSISDYEMLETRVLSLSSGLPLAIVDMIHQVSHEPVVTRERIREVYHEAGIHYRDWTAAIVVLWGVAIMFRFFALGTHSFEAYILAGFGTAMLMVLRFFAFRMR